MKFRFTFFLIVFQLLACSKKEAVVPDPPDPINLNPDSFDIMIDSVFHDRAEISWTVSRDPEGEVVKYDVWLNEQPVDSNLVVQKFSFKELTELTNYSGQIIAKDSKGNKTIKPFSFRTEKYYLRFLKLYEYDRYINALQPGGGEAKQIVEMPDKSYIILGASYIDGAYLNGSHLFAMKIDSVGNEIWKKYYPFHVGPAYDVAATLSAGNLLVVCLRNLVKIDSDGNLLWHKEFANYEEIRGVAEDGNGNIFIAGGKVGTVGITLQEGILTKLDPTGNQIWEKNFHPSIRAFFYDIQLTATNDIFVLGTMENNGLTYEQYVSGGISEQQDFWILKLTNEGEQIWQTTFGDSRFDIAGKIIQRSNGNITLIGTSWGVASDRKGRIIEISQDGNEIRNISYGQQLSFTLSATETADAGIITTGFTDMDPYSKALQTNKFNSNGIEEWNSLHYETGVFYFGRSIITTADGGYLIVASEAGYNGYGRPAHVAVFKTDPFGQFK